MGEREGGRGRAQKEGEGGWRKGHGVVREEGGRMEEGGGRSKLKGCTIPNPSDLLNATEVVQAFQLDRWPFCLGMFYHC